MSIAWVRLIVKWKLQYWEGVIQQTPRVSAMPVAVDPPKKPPASQAALPLYDPSGAKLKEAYVWDESKGID